MRVTQQGSNSGQDWPMQFSLAAEISRQKSTESGRSATSARSPVTVAGAQASTARKSGISSGRRKLPAWVKERDRKSTRLNSSHQIISYAVFCLKKKKKSSY